MPKPNEVALELKKFAAALEAMDSELDIPYIFLHSTHTNKESFLAFARSMPRPITKEVLSPEKEYAELRMRYKSDAITIWSSIKRSLTCELIEPAKPAVYRCEPILSVEDESTLEVL